MPVYKQIAKQQKRAKRKAEALLSDEDDGSSASDSDNASVASDSDEGSSDGDSDDEEEDDGLGGAGANAPLDEDAPRPPPEGFPTAQDALDNPVASTASLVKAMKDAEGDASGESDDEDEEEAPLVCVFCPNKVLKKGKMTEVHLASKDHKRRLNRFKAHLNSPNFPAEHLTSDARWVASQLDKAVLERLSLQTQVGGKKAGTVKPAAAPSASTSTPSKPSTSKAASTPSAATPSKPSTSIATPSKKPSTAEAKAAAIAAAEEAGTSVREQLRQQKKEQQEARNAKKRVRKEAKKDKNDRIKKRKVDNGESINPHIPSKPKFVQKIRPTDDEIAKRQAWKKARDEAKAKGLPAPPRPVLAYEHGGKAPAGKGKKGKAAAAGKDGKGAAAKEGDAKEAPKERVVNEARLAKRKERKVRRQAAKKEQAAKATEDVLEEV
ncbi:hypothetical protein JCM10207_003988 [Rhodosporidiobolus poonsookiae]